MQDWARCCGLWHPSPAISGCWQQLQPGERHSPGSAPSCLSQEGSGFEVRKRDFGCYEQQRKDTLDFGDQTR